MPEYVEEHDKRTSEKDPTDPNRYIGLAIAENKLVWDLLEPQINRERHVPERSAGYDDMIGSEQFRTTVASFASERVWGRTVEANEVITLAGAGSILEMLFYTLGDPGEAVLVPTPSYAGFWADIETRDALHIIPAHTNPDDDFALSVNALQAAYDSAQVPVRALLLTNPANPTGRIHSDDEIRDAIGWARSVGLHVVVNEVYALSAYSDTPFIPAGTIIDDIDDDVHFVWAFSKDFAMSGFRCGVMTSTNDDLRAAISELAYWSSVSGDTQHLLDSMLQDNVWVEGYLAEMQTRLRDSYGRTSGALTDAGIPFFPADAGLFLLCDLRKFLLEATWDAEQALWRRILEGANVNLTPGSACHIGEPGFMRLCFAQEPADVVVDAVERVASVLS
ncbi:MAG: pyridoxal phosphate-dependent aminotransferase [Acidimicrobiia bacterium]|nr:MAG: pyridoxal phosphate-dependent aminotransferase [Acidimicrobiia bacterium]